MPYKESFQNLIEVQSLQNQILKHKKVIDGEESRIEHLKGQRVEKAEMLSTLKDETVILNSNILKQEITLEKLDSSIDTAQNHLKNASTEKEMNALESEIKTWVDEKSILEESLLKDLDIQEIKTKEIQDISGFLKGSEETLKDLELEVKGLVNAENVKIDDLKERIGNLIEICQPVVKNLFTEANNNHEYDSPLALIEDNRCDKCQMHLPSSLTQPVESGKVIELCPNCGRLLVPHIALS
jgi:predicted  nucleic acid-binding Zn-ribbon protein